MTDELNTNYDIDPYDDDTKLGAMTPVPVKMVGETTALAADYGACQSFSVPQAAIGVVPVQLLLRRKFREEAYVLNNGPVSPVYSPSLQAFGTATSPAAGTNITTLAGIPAGVYQVTWSIEMDGTLTDGTDNNNLQLRNTTSGITYLRGINPAVAGVYQQQSITIVLGTVSTITVQVIAQATAGAIYSATLVATPLYSLGQGVNSYPVVLSHRPDTLQSASPIGLLLNVNQSQKFVSQQPVYAVAMGGIQTVSVLDQSWDSERSS